MGSTQNSGRTENLRPFKPGQSGNPGGRPRGLARYTRELVGEDGRKLADFWLLVLENVDAPLNMRLEASRLLAERGFGRPDQAVELGGNEDGWALSLKRLAALVDDDAGVSEVGVRTPTQISASGSWSRQRSLQTTGMASST